MNDVGIGVDDLVDAGMEMVVGVEKTQEIRDKLKKQIYHSLDDLNVVSFIIAGIRLEEDYEKHRVHGVDVDDDPAYLYSDEVFGMSVANQIAGTKAIFNFKRYDEAKPGIISKLGPVLDDVFAGLIAGCMSKVFEV
jgi:alpha-ribazole phosphatase CobZ